MANLLQGIGEAKPVSDFLNMALKYKDSTTQNALREQHANLLKMQTDKLAEEEAYRKQPYNMNLDPLLSAYEQGTPEHSDFKKKYFNLAQADQYGNTTMGNRDRAVGELAKDHVALKDLYDRKSQLMLDQYNKIQDDLSNANLTGDTAKVNKLTIMSDALKTKLIAASGHLATWDAANEKTKAAGAAVSKILVEPDTGERYTQLKSGAILDGQGNDVSSEIDTTNLIVEGSDKLPKDTVPSAIKEFESVYPGMVGKAGTPEYTKAYERWKVLAVTERTKVFSALPSNVPGIFFDRISKQFYETDSSGNQIPVSSADVVKRKLQVIEDTPTTDLKVMKQSAPSVLDLINKSEMALDKASKDMGPISGRFSEFMAGKVGSTNKDWISLRTNVKLLETRLMKMHVGARGGEYIMKHFESIFGYGYQSPDNMREALSNAKAYAQDIKDTSISPGGREVNPNPSPMTGPVKVWNPATKTFDVRQ